jgi:hypothetical protein
MLLANTKELEARVDGHQTVVLLSWLDSSPARYAPIARNTLDAGVRHVVIGAQHEDSDRFRRVAHARPRGRGAIVTAVMVAGPSKSGWFDAHMHRKAIRRAHAVGG